MGVKLKTDVTASNNEGLTSDAMPTTSDTRTDDKRHIGTPTTLSNSDSQVGRYGETDTSIDDARQLRKELSADTERGSSVGKIVGITLGSTTAVALATLLVLYEAGLLHDWLRMKYLNSGSANGSWLRKFITTGTLAHWKNSDATVILANDVQDALTSQNVESAIPLYDHIAIYRSLISSDDRLFQIGDYDLYETLIIEDAITGLKSILLYKDSAGAYHFEREDGAQLALKIPTAADLRTLGDLASWGR